MGLFRKVIRIRAVDSPNVRLGLRELEKGLEPSNTMVVPGVLSWEEYVQRRATWEEDRQCVGLDGEFWEGDQVMFFPARWLNRAGEYAALLDRKYRIGGFQSSGIVGSLGAIRQYDDGTPRQFYTLSSLRSPAPNPDSSLTIASASPPNDARLLPRKAEGIGVDPAEGGDSTAWAAVDRYGLIELLSLKTPNTHVIPRETLGFARRHGITDWARVVFDTGGGGKQHADTLRASGFKVQTVGFGESVKPPIRRGGVKKLTDRIDEAEEKYEYVNRRAEMYGELRELLDEYRVDENTGQPLFFGIPTRYTELIRQLSLMPLLRDHEGRMKMLPKSKKSADSKEKSLVEILGRSPDESDALVLAVRGILHSVTRVVAGAVRTVR